MSIAKIILIVIVLVTLYVIANATLDLIWNLSDATTYQTGM